jgi:SAM-dependent methyltransferase
MWPHSRGFVTHRWEEAQTAEKVGAVKLSLQAREVGNKFNCIIKEKFSHKVHIASNILEIGCGGYGVISKIEKAGLKIGIDPLMLAYADSYSLDDKSVYISGLGENIPVKEGLIDLCFCNNVLDHTSSPQRIVREIYRVLKPGGVSILGMYCQPNAFQRLIYSLKEKIKFSRDIYHPHHFTVDLLERMLKLSGFIIEHRYDMTDEVYNLHSILIQSSQNSEPVMARRIKTFIKYMLRLSRDPYIVFECRK